MSQPRRITPSLCAAAIVCLLASAARAQQHPSPAALSVHVGDGSVSVAAEGVSRAAILAEWARVGDVTLVDEANIADAAPTSLQLADVPEGKLLDALLGDVVGYVATLRPGSYRPGTSIYDRVLILRTTRAAESVSSPRRELTSLDLPTAAVEPGPTEELTSAPLPPPDVDLSRPEKTAETVSADLATADGAPPDAPEPRGELVTIPTP